MDASSVITSLLNVNRSDASSCASSVIASLLNVNRSDAGNTVNRNVVTPILPDTQQNTNSDDLP